MCGRTEPCRRLDRVGTRPRLNKSRRLIRPARTWCPEGRFEGGKKGGAQDEPAPAGNGADAREARRALVAFPRSTSPRLRGISGSGRHSRARARSIALRRSRQRFSSSRDRTLASSVALDDPCRQDVRLQRSPYCSTYPLDLESDGLASIRCRRRPLPRRHGLQADQLPRESFSSPGMSTPMRPQRADRNPRWQASGSNCSRRLRQGSSGPRSGS